MPEILAYLHELITLLRESIYDFPDHLQGLAALLHETMTPILLGTGGLLALISLRNGHLSDRSRGTAEEILYRLHTLAIASKPARLADLKEQNALFTKRYERSGHAFVFTIIAFGLFMFACTVGYKPAHIARSQIAGFCGLVAIALFATGLWYLINEFRFGILTLRINNKILNNLNLDVLGSDTASESSHA